MSPFYANYGFEAKPTHVMRDVEVVAEKAVVEVHQLKELHKQLSEDKNGAVRKP